MLRNLKLKVLLLTILMVIPLMFVATSYGSLKEPPTGTEHLSGPAILGTLTATLTDEGLINATLVGMCKNQIPIAVTRLFPATQITKPFAEATKEDIEDIRMNNAGPQGCYSESGGENLVINTVTKFNNTGTTIIAEVVVLYILPSH